MTTGSKKITVYVPEDVAATLGNVTNVSAYITEAVRHRASVADLREQLEGMGYHVTEDAKAKVRERLRAQTLARQARQGKQAA